MGGVLLDTSILIATERGAANPLPDETRVGIAAITASELLHGVLRSSSSTRPARTAFVEAILSTVPLQPFGLAQARVHADMCATLAAAGRLPGAHDLLIAATAVSLGWAVATLNARHFQDIPWLNVIVP